MVRKRPKHQGHLFEEEREETIAKPRDKRSDSEILACSLPWSYEELLPLPDFGTSDTAKALFQSCWVSDISREVRAHLSAARIWKDRYAKNGAWALSRSLEETIQVCYETLEGLVTLKAQLGAARLASLRALNANVSHNADSDL